MSDFKKTARPTTYQGVLFRSKSEACYAKWLTGKGYTWEYEPSRFSVGDYVPDFFIWKLTAGQVHSAIIEYKPAMVVDSYVSEFAERAKAIHEMVDIDAGDGQEEWRIERLNRVVQAIGCTEDVIRLCDDNDHLRVFFRPSCFTMSADFYTQTISTWEKETEWDFEIHWRAGNVQFFHGSVNYLEWPEKYLIHCGSFFEDSGAYEITCDPVYRSKDTERKTWLGFPDNFEERREVSQTRFDLRGVK